MRPSQLRVDAPGPLAPTGWQRHGDPGRRADVFIQIKVVATAVPASWPTQRTCPPHAEHTSCIIGGVPTTSAWPFSALALGAVASAFRVNVAMNGCRYRSSVVLTGLPAFDAAITRSARARGAGSSAGVWSTRTGTVSSEIMRNSSAVQLQPH